MESPSIFPESFCVSLEYEWLSHMRIQMAHYTDGSINHQVDSLFSYLYKFLKAIENTKEGTGRMEGYYASLKRQLMELHNDLRHRKISAIHHENTSLQKYYEFRCSDVLRGDYS